MPPGAGPEWVETEVIEVGRPDPPEEPHQRPHVVVLRERDRPGRRGAPAPGRLQARLAQAQQE
jgi:hypothetical protein